MDWLTHIPALIRIFMVLVIVMAALKLRISLTLSMLLGSVFLGIFFMMTPGEFTTATISGTFSLDTLSLVIIVAGILILSNAMSHSGRLDRIVGTFKELVGGSRISLITFPALIGLLPMPGGAVFSAPMVGAASERSTLDPNRKTIINYWFRHIWEYWFPLYPGVILALTLTHVPPWKFILLNMPMTLVGLGAGYMITLRHVSLGDSTRVFSRKNVRRFLNELIPIMLMVFTLLGAGVIINVCEKTFNFSSKPLERSPIVLGLVLSISWVAIADKIEFAELKGIIFKRSVWELGLLVIAIMIFRSVLEKSGGIVSLRDELMTYNIPLLGIIIILPLVAGIVTGIAIGFVGVSFPIIVSLLGATEGAPSQLYAPIFLAYVCGYIGMMLSPVHLCLLLTKDYFKANLVRVYFKYLAPLGIVSLCSAGIFYIIYSLLKL